MVEFEFEIRKRDNFFMILLVVAFIIILALLMRVSQWVEMQDKEFIEERII